MHASALREDGRPVAALRPGSRRGAPGQPSPGAWTWRSLREIFRNSGSW